MTAYKDKESKPTVNVAGVGFFGLLALLFIGLRLGHVIDWPWYLVLAPLWGPPSVALGFVLAIAVVFGLAWGTYYIALGLYRFCFR